MLAHLIRPTGGRAGCVNIAGWRCWRILSGLQAGGCVNLLDGDAGASYPAYRRACGVCEHCRMAMLAHLIRPTGGYAGCVNLPDGDAGASYPAYGSDSCRPDKRSAIRRCVMFPPRSPVTPPEPCGSPLIPVHTAQLLMSAVVRCESFSSC